MIDFGLGIGSFNPITILLLWIGLMALAIWLVTLLFPVAKKQSAKGDGPFSTQKVLKIGQAQSELTKGCV